MDLSPTLHERLTHHALRLVEATAESLAGLGELVDEPERHRVEIVTWPAQGWRPVDPGTGNEGGTTEGIFRFWWDGEVYRGANEAVADAYLLGWSAPPLAARTGIRDVAHDQVLLWHANYHPDGGQLFFPLERRPFVVPLAPPGDDLRPDAFKAFWFAGTKGLYIHPGIWHEAIFVAAAEARFFDKQGKVHARVSCDFTKEFDCLLEVPLRRD
jgi:ureidoglycolate lyase